MRKETILAWFTILLIILLFMFFLLVILNLNKSVNSLFKSCYIWTSNFF